MHNTGQQRVTNHRLKLKAPNYKTSTAIPPSSHPQIPLSYPHHKSHFFLPILLSPQPNHYRTSNHAPNTQLQPTKIPLPLRIHTLPTARQFASAAAQWRRFPRTTATRSIGAASEYRSAARPRCSRRLPLFGFTLRRGEGEEAGGW